MEILETTVSADSLEIGDAIVVDDDFITVTALEDTEDIDEVLVIGISEVSGEKVDYPLYFADEFSLWGA
jgi:hypothetical protein